MEPSRERDGDKKSGTVKVETIDASMEPSRERDGDLVACPACGVVRDKLQWSRRANATETRFGPFSAQAEHGLQWSRRANATETPSTVSSSRSPTPRLQWSRRANATETPRRSGDPGPA